MNLPFLFRDTEKVAELQEFDLWSICGLHLWSNCGLYVVYMWSTLAVHACVPVVCVCAAARSARKRVAAPNVWERNTSTAALRSERSLSSGWGVPGARGYASQRSQQAVAPRNPNT